MKGSNFATPRTARAVCARCRRPTSVCYCASLTTLHTVTRVVILQHPRERDMPIGTARMAALCLPQASVHVGVRWGGDPAFRAAISDPARPAILLYPGPGARDVFRDPPPSPVTLVVVDGTWAQTRSVVRGDPDLGALPRYAFTAPEPSVYRVRREPREEYVSTIEALMHVLGALEGDAERFRALLTPFRAMVDAHLAAQARCPRARERLPRPARSTGSRVAPEIVERFDDLVCVAAEASSWPYAAGQRAQGDELVHWVARRVSTGEAVDLVAAPQRPLSPGTPERIGLDEDRLRCGVPVDDLVEAFARFTRPRDVVCSWGLYAPRLLESNGGALPAARLDLRLAARRLENRSVGTLDEYAASVGWAAPPAPASRATCRVERMVRIVEAWRTRA